MKRRTFLKSGMSMLGAGAFTASSAHDLFRFPHYVLACRRPVKVRRNIYELYREDVNHPIIENYRKAVDVMKSRPDSDPTSWAYQANIHGTTLSPGSWPAGAPFATCEHGTQFFLSWHRMYLYFFEKIVRKACGNPDFALPYWDWSTNRRLPPPFRDSAASVNPLHDVTRNSGVNSGNQMPASAVVVSDDLNQTNYFDFQSGIEGTPHGAVHGAIGGNMGNFAGAGRDPIFWLHHCNIDRFWEVWLYTATGHSNPMGDATWLNQTYSFATETGALVSMTGSEILDTQTQLRYVYEHTCTPVFPVLAASFVLATAQPRWKIISSHPIAKGVRVNAAEPTVLHPEDDATREKLFESLERFAALEKEVRILLQFEGIRSEAPVNGYVEVYVNQPKDSKPYHESPYYAGNIDFFGADAESRKSMAATHKAHPGHGLNREINLTDTIQRLTGRGEFDVKSLSITLVPTGVAEEGKTFRFDNRSNLSIDLIMLSVVRAPR